jgi:hypothetical protein
MKKNFKFQIYDFKIFYFFANDEKNKSIFSDLFIKKTLQKQEIIKNEIPIIGCGGGFSSIYDNGFNFLILFLLFLKI